MMLEMIKATMTQLEIRIKSLFCEANDAYARLPNGQAMMMLTIHSVFIAPGSDRDRMHSISIQTGNTARTKIAPAKINNKKNNANSVLKIMAGNMLA